MKRKTLIRTLAGILAAAELFSLSGCRTIKAKPLSTGSALTDTDPASPDTLQDGTVTIADFSVRLLQQTFSEKNTLLSPLSVLYAMTMAANGAEGETFAQMESTLGDMELLSSVLPSVACSLASDKNPPLHMANSLWLHDGEGFAVRQEYLDKMRVFYDAAIYQASFDRTTTDDINQWVSGQTGGMIENMLDSIGENAVMLLINAVSFDADWKKAYADEDVQNGFFTAENGTRQEISLMYSEETAYLSCENAEGFRKPYKNSRYAFAALLPDEGVSMAEFIASLDGEKLADILQGSTSGIIHAAIPKFTANSSLELTGTFKKMGITNAFEPNLADFGGIGSYGGAPLYITSVLHKTRLELDETGTKAAAASVVEMGSGAATESSGTLKRTIILDRPFLYMIVDTYSGIPIFLGVCMEP